MEFIEFAKADPLLDWIELTKVLEEGHKLPKAQISDTLLQREPDTLLSRSAWIDGLGVAVKSATIFPENVRQEKPTINGGMCLFSDIDGMMEAVIDFHLVTKWKTAGDSLLAARHLARPDSKNVLIVGAGTVAASLMDAYGALFPDANFTIWNRTQANAEKLAAERSNLKVTDNLEVAVRAADIVASATMATDPFLYGDWFQPGQHIDLIGAYRPDMREADDHAISRSRLFVDSRDTTLDHIGELKLPLSKGVITSDDVVSDFYGLKSGDFKRKTPDEITLFKNGGGAHLDLMTGRYILQAWLNR